MSSPDTPTREQMDEFDAHKALANVLLAHQPRRSPLGDTLCACGMSFKAIDARAWHRHAAAMVENYLAALPPARPAEPTSEAVAWGVTQTITGDDGNCLEACIATIFALPLDAVPRFRDDEWWGQLLAFLAERGLTCRSTMNPPSGLSVAVGESPRRSVKHAVVAINGFLAFDPHPDRTFFRPASDVSFLEISPLAHPLPSDAPSGWDTDVRLVLSEVATWITLAHHRDGCRQRYSEACTCGRDSILAKLKFPASPPQDAPRLAEVAIDKQFSGTWNNWIAPFHRCAFCGGSLNWQQSVDVFDRPLITASCACGVMYSARLGEEGLEQARAVDAGNKLAALCVAPAAPVDLSAVEAAIDEDRLHDRLTDIICQYNTEEGEDGGMTTEQAVKAMIGACKKSLHRTALSGVPAKEAGETNNG